MWKNEKPLVKPFKRSRYCSTFPIYFGLIDNLFSHLRRTPPESNTNATHHTNQPQGRHKPTAGKG